MASIHIECPVAVSADTAWDALRRVGEPDRLFAPVLTGAELRGDTRTVHFQNGLVVHERVIDVDEGRATGLLRHATGLDDEGPTVEVDLDTLLHVHLPRGVVPQSCCERGRERREGKASRVRLTSGFRAAR